LGEDLATAYLERAGWRILDRNWRCDSGELDIVARDPGGVVVFCEVKTRRSKAFGPPLEAITRAKMQKLRDLAVCWLRSQRSFARKIRFDGIGILIEPGRDPQITHKPGIGS
jgi:putative endonuclease